MTKKAVLDMVKVWTPEEILEEIVLTQFQVLEENEHWQIEINDIAMKRSVRSAYGTRPKSYSSEEWARKSFIAASIVVFRMRTKLRGAKLDAAFDEFIRDLEARGVVTYVRIL